MMTKLLRYISEGEWNAVLNLQKMEAGYGESMVVRDVNLEVKPGQIVCLMGRNGVGKSTLMKSIMGLIQPKSGTIHYNERNITSFPPDRRAKSGIGYVPQGREIFPQLTVEENLLLGLEAATDGRKKLPDISLRYVSRSSSNASSQRRRPQRRAAAAISHSPGLSPWPQAAASG